MFARIVEKILARFVSKKLGAFLGSLALGLLAAAKLEPQARDAFLEFCKWLAAAYLGAQGLADAVENYKRGGTK